MNNNQLMNRLYKRLYKLTDQWDKQRGKQYRRLIKSKDENEKLVLATEIMTLLKCIDELDAITNKEKKP